jgi:predicted dehydrogenase
LGGGTLLDIGEYCLYLAVLAFKGKKPEKIISVGKLNEKGVDMSGSVVLSYDGGAKTATFSYSSMSKLPNEAFIVGDKGILKASEA